MRTSRMLVLLGAALLALTTANCGGDGPPGGEPCSEAEENGLTSRCYKGFLELCASPSGHWFPLDCEPPGRCALGGDCGSDGWCHC
jgi:hypothetical protein